MTIEPLNKPSSEPNAPQALEQQREGFAPVRDRLITTLFLVALLHIILITGITFVEPIGTYKDITPTLKVLLLNESQTDDKQNIKGTYLSQRDQKGSGNIADEQLRGSPDNDLFMMNNEGSENGNSLQRTQRSQMTLSVKLISTTHSGLASHNSDSDDAETSVNQTPLELTPSLPSPISTQISDNGLSLNGPTTREAIITPDTRATPFAAYAERWRSKIERFGTLNYPLALQSRKNRNNPVLEVVIGAEGTLKSAAIKRSSGDPAVDQAALNILKLATPFESFSSELKKNYDQLRFAYEWQFLDR